MQLNDMRPADIVGKAESTHLKYADGSSRTVLTVDEEVPYPDGRLIVSCTDLAGVITQCNRSFIEMSGFAREELIGAPQHILRHPQMPAAAYKDLWETISAGNKWRGYVKNLRKDGRYYWVYATIIPNVRKGKIVAYTSVRRKPSRSKIAESEKLYATLN